MRIYLQAVFKANTENGKADTNKYHILPSVTKWDLYNAKSVRQKGRHKSIVRTRGTVTSLAILPLQSNLYLRVVALLSFASKKDALQESSRIPIEA